MIRAILALLLLGMSVVVSAAEDPAKMLSRESDALIEAIIDYQKQLQPDQKQAQQIIRQRILPLVDSKALVRGILGKYSRKASKEQLNAFQHIFTEVMVRTYAKAFSLYKNERLEFQASRFNKKGNRAKVKGTLYRSDGGPPVTLVYKLALVEDRWLIRDLAVEGISMVTSYRSQISSKIQKHGLTEVISQFDQKLQTLKKPENNQAVSAGI